MLIRKGASTFLGQKIGSEDRNEGTTPSSSMEGFAGPSRGVSELHCGQTSSQATQLYSLLFKLTIKFATAIELYWLQIYNLHNTRALYYNRKALMALSKAIELYRLQIYNQFNSKSLKLQSQSIDAIAHCHLSSISKE